MPDYFSHKITAEVIYGKLPEEVQKKITSKDTYLLGAQGGDLYFFYKFTPTKSNMGISMHHMDPKVVFEALLQGDFSYLAGFCTHYALDSKFHPPVYDFAKGHGFMTHVRLEADLGRYFSEKFKINRDIIDWDRVILCKQPILESITKLVPSITDKKLERGMKRHYRYTIRMKKGCKDKYKTKYNFSLFDSPTVEAVDFAVKLICEMSKGHLPKSDLKAGFLEGKYKKKA